MKSGSLSFLETSGPVQACNGIALPLPLPLNITLPVPVTARSKAYVCGCSRAEIAGSNPTGGMDVSVVSVVCCQVEVSATS